MEYTVIYEQGPANWSAYSPDVPGCAAAAETREEVERLFREALVFHLAGMRAQGLPMPVPSTEAGKVHVSV